MKGQVLEFRRPAQAEITESIIKENKTASRSIYGTALRGLKAALSAFAPSPPAQLSPEIALRIPNMKFDPATPDKEKDDVAAMAFYDFMSMTLDGPQKRIWLQAMFAQGLISFRLAAAMETKWGYFDAKAKA